MNDKQPSGERLERAKRVLHEALAREPGVAADWIREQLADDAMLTDYVLDLLGSAGAPTLPFDDVKKVAGDYVDSLRPECIGHYRILETLGEGGMGTVYLAEQTEPMHRRVALKLIKLGMDSRAVVARFELERRSLAMMEHDGIAKVHDCGTSARGQPYFVMELVRGAALATYCDNHKLSLSARMELLEQVCAAVQHAHQKGVVHRDLKPSNVLVVETDGRPQIKVIDFGLAKAMGHGVHDTSLLTLAGQIVGTPEYMAPEQADAGNQDVDTRADVYSLGVMLYELLVGSLPFAETELRGLSQDEMHRVMRDVEPPRPSARLRALDAQTRESVVACRGIHEKALLRALHADLDWLVLCAMAKDRNERYESPAALAADLQRFLNHEPLVAGPPSTVYRLRKFVRRYRAQVVAVGAVLLTAITGAIVAGGFAVEAFELAEQKSQLAVAEAEAKAEATKSAELLAGKVREFDLLAGVVQHKQAVIAERELYPAWPMHAARLQSWLQGDAADLQAMKGDVERALASLRERALPRTEQMRDRDRQSHARWDELQAIRSWVEGCRRAAAVRDGEDLDIPEVPAAMTAFAPRILWRMALARMAPQPAQRTVAGKERLGLALARLAAERAAGAAFEADATDLLAWAWFMNGEDDKALACSARAVASATGAALQRSQDRYRELEIAVANAPEDLARWEGKLLDLEAIVGEVRTFEFERKSQRFLHDALVILQQDLLAFEAHQVQYVTERLAWARRIASLSENHANARVSWQDARVALAAADGVTASKLYGAQKIELTPRQMMGLVPIGMNPVTMLWEFYHLASAGPADLDPAQREIPRHAADGSIDVTKDTGIVFVLVPGGEFTMGAQSVDANASNYEVDAKWYVQPPHLLRLSAFLLARHEVTQAQWARLQRGDDSARWPSAYRAGALLEKLGERITATHPVNQVDYATATEVMRRQGLLLPTEAQWEYACRAGTDSPWFCKLEELHLYANLSDQKAARFGAEWAEFEDWDDGYVVTAPVQAFRSHPWGFQHIVGNVLEWCRDELVTYEWPGREGDGLRTGPNGSKRVVRGGCTNTTAEFAKSSMRTPMSPTTRFAHIGLRPARSLHPKAAR